MQPVRGVGESEKFGVGAVTQTFLSHFGQKKSVALAPEDACGDMYSAILELGPMAEKGAIPIDHGGECAGLGPRGAVLREIVLGERAGTAGAEKRSRADAKIEGGEDGFGQDGELKEKDVPASEKLAQAGVEEFAHHGGMRDVENREFSDALRMQEGGAPGNGGTPIVPGEEDALLA